MFVLKDEGVGEDAETDEEKKATEARAAKIKKLLGKNDFSFKK